MKLKRWLTAVLLGCLLLTAAGCSSEGGVYVQSVQTLMELGGIAPGDRFAGLVVSEHVTEITKDTDKTVEELLVKEGDDVKEGQALFTYDMDALQLSVDKQKLELEQIRATISNYYAQISALEKESKNLTGTAKLQYTVQIQTTRLDLKEAEINAKAKEEEVKKAKALLENATVTSPVAGRVQSINENGTDNYGNPVAYITIQQAGSYRIKGTLGELQRGALAQGDKITILSRTDEKAKWTGSVTLVDYESPTQGSQFDMYYGMQADEMTSSSKYPFYVALDSTDGLMLGQHVYMEKTVEAGKAAGVSISSAFIAYDEDGSPYVWAEKNGKLEKRAVTLGDYNAMADLQEITKGLTAKDYIAFPDPELCTDGAATTHDKPAEEAPVTEDEVA